MFGHARAEDVVKEILCVLDKLAIPLRLMLSLGMDWPNVNKSIMHKMNQVKKEKGYQTLVKFPPSCSIHIFHNSFPESYGSVWIQWWGIMPNFYNFFRRSSCRQKNSAIEETLGLEELIVLHHVQSQWLSIFPTSQCLVTIKDAVKKLLLEDMLKNDRKTSARMTSTCLSSFRF